MFNRHVAHRSYAMARFLTTVSLAAYKLTPERWDRKLIEIISENLERCAQVKKQGQELGEAASLYGRARKYSEGTSREGELRIKEARCHSELGKKRLDGAEQALSDHLGTGRIEEAARLLCEAGSSFAKAGKLLETIRKDEAFDAYQDAADAYVRAGTLGAKSSEARPRIERMTEESLGELGMTLRDIVGKSTFWRGC